MTAILSPNVLVDGALNVLPSIPQSNYGEAEQQFTQLLATEDLDQQVYAEPTRFYDFEVVLATALVTAYTENSERLDQAHIASLFLQRILYHINRLNLFWYDDLQNYTNERSIYLQWIRDRIEIAWQAWELSQLDVEQLQQVDVKQALSERARVDLEPPISEHKRFLREHMTVDEYRHLLMIASLDGLVESSRLSRILGGASNEIHAALFRVLIEEYGNGRLKRKHSTFFAQMMAELGLQTEPETYFNSVPWEVLACINHNFLLTERKRHFLRYNGGLTYFEIAGPSIYTDYRLAAQRLGLSDSAMGYWELHIREDERHGQWMLNEVALPLAEQYPTDAWELVLGYDQEKLMGDRAGAAVIQAIKKRRGGFCHQTSTSSSFVC